MKRALEEQALQAQLSASTPVYDAAVKVLIERMARNNHFYLHQALAQWESNVLSPLFCSKYLTQIQMNEQSDNYIMHRNQLRETNSSVPKAKRKGIFVDTNELFG